MVRFNILSGKSAGSHWEARRFPIMIGRAETAQFRLEDPGVWDQHLELSLLDERLFEVSAQSQGIVTINGITAQRAALRTGDIIQLGAARIQFWLANTQQRTFRPREWTLWFSIVAVSLCQIWLAYRISR
jgi:predicted component of type VI protein secretion system